jgi:shikimate 5-dehydrogenase
MSGASPEARTLLSSQKETSPGMKKNVLIIGAGGVAQVVAHKCAQNNDVLGDIHIASRTLAKCQSIVD